MNFLDCFSAWQDRNDDFLDTILQNIILIFVYPENRGSFFIDLA